MCLLWYILQLLCSSVHNNTLSSAQKLPKTIFLTQTTHWRLLGRNFSARSPLFSGTDALFWKWCSWCHFASAITVSRIKSAKLHFFCFLITHALLSEDSDELYRFLVRFLNFFYLVMFILFIVILILINFGNLCNYFYLYVGY